MLGLVPGLWRRLIVEVGEGLFAVDGRATDR
jgi:hypothetical protein